MPRQVQINAIEAKHVLLVMHVYDRNPATQQTHGASKLLSMEHM